MKTFGKRYSLLETTRLLVLAGLLVSLGLTIGIPSLADANDLRRKFYLTTTPVDGLGALNACDSRFHMASLYEIFDTSNLKYDTNRGQTAADSGAGPPSGVNGWIRTGYSSDDSGFPGQANCAAWTSNNGILLGTAVRLREEWDASAGLISPWKAAQGPEQPFCDATLPVWCVQNDKKDNNQE
jgi:hypothetical protein